MFDNVRAWNRHRKAKRLLNRKPIMTPHNFFFSGPKSMMSGEFEKLEVNFLNSKLPTATSFVNIGANFGYYCCLASKFDLKIFALEPIPINFNLLLKNLSFNKVSNCVLLPVAAGRSSEYVEIFGEGTGASIVKGWARNPSALRHLAPIVKIDDVIIGNMLGERPFFLMDVEGFEYEALLGAVKLIQNRKLNSTWMVEIGLKAHTENENSKYIQTFDLFFDNGYKTFKIDNPENILTKKDIVNYVDSSDYISANGNFVFYKS